MVSEDRVWTPKRGLNPAQGRVSWEWARGGAARAARCVEGRRIVPPWPRRNRPEDENMRGELRACGVAALIIGAMGLAPGAALAGPDWSELGDAGSLAGASQTPVGSGPLMSISGSLSSGLVVPD